MTPQQLAALKVGDHVSLWGMSGRISQTTPSWFMVTWHGRDTPEMFKRSSEPTIRMELHA